MMMLTVPLLSVVVVVVSLLLLLLLLTPFRWYSSISVFSVLIVSPHTNRCDHTYCHPVAVALV